MFKLHAETTYTKYDKICVIEKNPHVKRDIELNDLGFLCYLRRSKELFNIKLKLILR